MNWQIIQWLSFTKDNLYTMFYKDTLNHDEDFDKLIRSPDKGNQQQLSAVKQWKIYNVCRPVPVDNEKDMLDLLPYV